MRRLTWLEIILSAVALPVIILCGFVMGFVVFGLAEFCDACWKWAH